MPKKMTIEELKEAMTGLLSVTEQMNNTPYCKGKETDLLKVLEGSFKRNYVRLEAIRLLCDNERLASSAFELTRNMVEDVVSVEYLISKDGNTLQRFFEFRWVQLKQDMEEYKASGLDVVGLGYGDDAKNVEKEFARVIKEYPDFLHTDSTGQQVPTASWIKGGVEGMVLSLKKHQKLADDDIRRIVRVYVHGCRKTHFNPYDVWCYFHPDTFKFTSDVSLKLSLLVSISSLIRLAVRYIEAISKIEDNRAVYEDVVEFIEKWLKQVGTATDLE